MGLITRIKHQLHLATTMPTTDTTITFQDVLHHMQTDILTMAIDDLSEESHGHHLRLTPIRKALQSPR